MGKNRTKTPGEGYMRLPAHPSYSGSTCALIVDTHTHLLSTFASYREKYPTSKYETVFDFVRGIYCSQTPPPDIQGAVSRHKVGAIIDVWCEAPIRKDWKELADSALTLEDRTNKWGGIEYYFVIGVHPHEAKLFNDAVEADILEALKHPRCVGYGEIGLDYHYNNSPPEVQRAVLIRQLRTAVRLGKPLTIHTREADEDIERILKAEVPKNHLIHVHCFTDSVQLAANLLDYFPNLYIGVTGVITYSTNLNTSAVMRHLVSAGDSPATSTSTSTSGSGSGSLSPLRILLETDAPYMVPANLTAQTLSLKSGQKLPLSHSGMIPWTAEFVANVVGGEPEGWDAGRVLEVSRANARAVYGV